MMTAITANASLNTAGGANTASAEPTPTPISAGSHHNRMMPPTSMPVARCD